MEKRILLASLAAFTLAIAIVVPHGDPSSTAAAAAAAPTPSASAAPSTKDPCGATKSKWAHLQCQQFNNSAPGDEYFGRLKISYLGIDNTFKDGSISAGAYTTDQNLIKKLMFADEALQRWAAKYPNDPQLARSYFLGVQVFRKVYTQPGQDVAWHYVQILVHKYPSTYFGKNMKAALANGYTEHWFAVAQTCPTPLPKSVPSNTAIPKGVLPSNTPSATATPSPAPGQPAIDIITPPCVQPSPTETPELSSTASPSPKATR